MVFASEHLVSPHLSVSPVSLISSLPLLHSQQSSSDHLWDSTDGDSKHLVTQLNFPMIPQPNHIGKGDLYSLGQCKY